MVCLLGASVLVAMLIGYATTKHDRWVAVVRQVTLRAS